MKLVMIAYNEALDQAVEDLLDHHGIQGYTKWTKVHGKGRSSGPHLGTHVWPKANNVVAAVVDDEAAHQALEGVRELRGRLAQEGVKAFVVPCDEVT